MFATLLRWWRSGRAAAAPALPPAAAPRLNAAELAAGSVLGAYRVAQRIGSGSTGTVYRAVDVRDARVVALKVLTLGRVGGDAGVDAPRERFLRESATARRLQHPDIVDVLDVGEARGLGWLAMTLAPGHDLQRHTGAGQLLPLPLVIEIGARVAAALAHAHRHGVVHRDVKPANVLVAAADTPDTADPVDAARLAVTLTDFGIARIVEGAGVAAASATRSGLLLGTVAYMSPEQLAGARVDAGSDLYALGAMLFQLLAGRLPHEADSLAQQMHAIGNLPAPELRVLRPEVGAALSATVARLLAKAPAERGSDGDALAAELRLIAAAMRPISGALPAGGAESLPDPRHNSRH